jgi:cystathionine beta-lyase family protein involved in aluminum resistance
MRCVTSQNGCYHAQSVSLLISTTLSFFLQLISFCEAVQKRSPVGAYIRPIPGMSPGYGDEVIFADGTFVDGSTLELSADGPLREPFVAFTQVIIVLFLRSLLDARILFIQSNFIHRNDSNESVWVKYE